ncbi:MAG: hypothetical protein WCL49_02280 [bacterium]|jgi:hypothetical protein
MDNFWKWLKKANARTVFFCLLAALAVVTVWWGWKLTTPIWTPPPATGAPRDQTTPGLGILTYLQDQQTLGTNRAASLFMPPETVQPPPKKQEKAEPANPPPKTEPNKDPVKSPPSPVQKTITLTYRGLYVRGDGVPVALITDSQNQRSTFYSAGSTLFGLILTTIEAETMGVKQPDQSSATLKRGVPQSFPENHHAN